ncbi:MAG: peptide chain release factor N(5)-glutamine methyltransferase [Desulfobacterota bacterium]|nr:peptide chain release factor N(5)-glutamine methyltransferase [Thermodesulfobacteriota bacterium]
MKKRDLLLSVSKVKKEEIICIISYVLNESKEKVLSTLDELIGELEKERIASLIKEREKGRPLAYITGRKEFYSLEFLVNESCLIPRPETELIVEEAEKIIKTGGVERILDMGTGSGIIGITLAKRTGVPVLCIDISKEALFIAKRNARLNRAEEKVVFLCSDLFCALNSKKKFDLILANLPYVAQEEWEELPVDVREYEPKVALWGGKDGLEVIGKFVDRVDRYISFGGRVLLEFGNQKQKSILKSKLEERGFHVEILKDYSGRERVIKGVWKNLS